MTHLALRAAATAVFIATAIGIAAAQDTATLRPVASALTVGVGGGHVRDTYLTPLLYDGTVTSLHYERSRVAKATRWSNQQRLAAEYTTADDRRDNTQMRAGRLYYRYAMHWAVRPVRTGAPQRHDWNIMLGAYGGLDAGFDYNLKLASSNTPVNARLSQNVGLSAAATWHYGRRAVPLTLSVQAPLAGWAFMPDYGASYYEMFALDTDDRYIHFSSLHNQQDLDVRLTTDVHTRRYPVRLGVAYRIETMHISHITERFSSLQIVVGAVIGHIPFSREQARRRGYDDYVMP